MEIETNHQEISGAPYIFVPIEIQKEIKLKSTLEEFSKLSGNKNTADYFDEWIASHCFIIIEIKWSIAFQVLNIAC